MGFQKDLGACQGSGRLPGGWHCGLAVGFLDPVVCGTWGYPWLASAGDLPGLDPFS